MGVSVLVLVGVRVGVLVGVLVRVGVAVFVGVAVPVFVAVRVVILVGVTVAVFVIVLVRGRGRFRTLHFRLWDTAVVGRRQVLKPKLAFIQIAISKRCVLFKP